MNWGSPSEFFAMGGHGLYVWSSFGVLALLIIIEIVTVKRKRKQALLRLKRMERIAEAREKMVSGNEG